MDPNDLLPSFSDGGQGIYRECLPTQLIILHQKLQMFPKPSSFTTDKRDQKMVGIPGLHLPVKLTLVVLQTSLTVKTSVICISLAKTDTRHCGGDMGSSTKGQCRKKASISGSSSCLRIDYSLIH